MHFYKGVPIYISSKLNSESYNMDIKQALTWLDPHFAHIKPDDVLLPKLNATSTRSVFTSRRLHKQQKKFSALRGFISSFAFAGSDSPTVADLPHRSSS